MTWSISSNEVATVRCNGETTSPATSRLSAGLLRAAKSSRTKFRTCSCGLPCAPNPVCDLPSSVRSRAVKKPMFDLPLTPPAPRPPDCYTIKLRLRAKIDSKPFDATKCRGCGKPVDKSVIPSGHCADRVRAFRFDTGGPERIDQFRRAAAYVAPRSSPNPRRGQSAPASTAFWVDPLQTMISAKGFPSADAMLCLRFLWIVERHFCELGLVDV
jgi:hypothetical protein